jgi:hypothetical protein
MAEQQAGCVVRFRRDFPYVYRSLPQFEFACKFSTKGEQIVQQIVFLNGKLSPYWTPFRIPLAKYTYIFMLPSQSPDQALDKLLALVYIYIQLLS